MNTRMTSPVLIVGAGPTGLTAALELSRLGVGVRIVDRAPERVASHRGRWASRPAPSSCCGSAALATSLCGWATPRDRPRSTRTAGKLAAIELHRMPSEFNYVLLLAQSETERLLTEQLNRQGVKVERGVELIDADPTARRRLRGAAQR